MGYSKKLSLSGPLKKGLIWVEPPKKMLKKVGSTKNSTSLMGQHLCDLLIISNFSHVYQGMRVFVSFPKVLIGWTGASQDYLVSLGNEFTDVTLVWEDGQLVEAHKGSSLQKVVSTSACDIRATHSPEGP